MTFRPLRDKEEGSAIPEFDKGFTWKPFYFKAEDDPLSSAFYSEIRAILKMNHYLDQYLHYLIVEKGLSRNTIEAYSRG